MSPSPGLVRVRTSLYQARGKLMVMGDPDSPNANDLVGRRHLPFVDSADIKDYAGLLVICHPADEAGVLRVIEENDL